MPVIRYKDTPFPSPPLLKTQFNLQPDKLGKWAIFSTQVVCCPLRPLRSIFSFVFPLKLVLFKDLVGSTFLMKIKLDVGQTYCITRSCQGALVYEIEI